MQLACTGILEATVTSSPCFILWFHLKQTVVVIELQWVDFLTAEALTLCQQKVLDTYKV